MVGSNWRQVRSDTGEEVGMTVMAENRVASRPFENVKDDFDPGIFTENAGQVKLMARGRSNA
jgi:hypothetical protein